MSNYGSSCLLVGSLVVSSSGVVSPFGAVGLSSVGSFPWRVTSTMPGGSSYHLWMVLAPGSLPSPGWFLAVSSLWQAVDGVSLVPFSLGSSVLCYVVNLPTANGVILNLMDIGNLVLSPSPTRGVVTFALVVPPGFLLVVCDCLIPCWLVLLVGWLVLGGDSCVVGLC